MRKIDSPMKKASTPPSITCTMNFMSNIQMIEMLTKAPTTIHMTGGMMWLYSSGHTETQNSHSLRGVFDEPTHDEKVSRRV
jgi:hypothetical protein